LRALVHWLEEAGYQWIVLVDNDSTFGPLLEYYEQTPHQVLRLGANLGHLAVWEADVLATLGHEGMFVVTDPDVVPDEACPPDAVEHFADLLEHYGEVDKVGFGLRIDDLPATYEFRTEVMEWESQFWETEVEAGVFRADIDTTFALYRPHTAAGDRRALRTGPPYVARHMGWYSDSHHLSEEERYYRAHAMPGVSNWDTHELPQDLRDALAQRRTQKAAPVSEPARRVRLGGEMFEVGDAPTHRPFWDLVDTGGWEPATIEALSRLTPSRVYIDVGAWIGPTVLLAARMAETVVAYEPDPVAAMELRANVARNGLTNVEVREIALFDRDGDLPFGPGMLDELGLSVSSLVYGSATTTIRSCDARHEAASPEFERAALVKIDVEGAEYRLIQRLAPYLRRHHPTLLLSLHAVRWRDRTFVPAPRWVNAAIRWLANAAERAPLLWMLRHYRYWYLDTLHTWQPLPLRSRLRLLGHLGEQALLLSNEPYPESPLARDHHVD
jgi:FkbM family methyltransferase